MEKQTQQTTIQVLHYDGNVYEGRTGVQVLKFDDGEEREAGFCVEWFEPDGQRRTAIFTTREGLEDFCAWRLYDDMRHPEVTEKSKIVGVAHQNGKIYPGKIIARVTKTAKERKVEYLAEGFPFPAQVIGADEDLINFTLVIAEEYLDPPPPTFFEALKNLFK